MLEAGGGNAPGIIFEGFCKMTSLALLVELEGMHQIAAAGHGQGETNIEMHEKHYRAFRWARKEIQHLRNENERLTNLGKAFLVIKEFFQTDPSI